MTADLVCLVAEVTRSLVPELDSFAVTNEPPGDYPFDGEGLWLHLSVGDEWFHLLLDGDASQEALVERLRWNLQDWVAESRFGWAELRVR